VTAEGARGREWRDRLRSGADECGVCVRGVVLGKVYPLSPPNRLGLILPVGPHIGDPGDSADTARVVAKHSSPRLQWGTVANAVRRHGVGRV